MQSGDRRAYVASHAANSLPAIDWRRIAADLAAHGYATMRLLDARTAADWPRSTMTRRTFAAAS